MNTQFILTPKVIENKPRRVDARQTRVVNRVCVCDSFVSCFINNFKRQKIKQEKKCFNKKKTSEALPYRQKAIEKVGEYTTKIYELSGKLPVPIFGHPTQQLWDSYG